MGRSRLGASLLLVACCYLPVGCALDTPVIQKGANQRHGVLLNYSCGAGPCDSIDPDKPTIVITHGWNPAPKLIRCTFGPSGAAALRCRCGDSYNLLSWDWNAVRVKATNNEPVRIGKEQGRMLAAALLARGVDPGRTQIIAHSLGTLAASQAAQCLAHSRGRVLQLTMLDPPARLHEEIFDKLRPTAHACIVENYYCPSPSGYGDEVRRPGVRNYVIQGVHPVIGVVDLSRSDHVYVMRWYYETMRCPAMKCGFQKSALLCYCGTGGPCAANGATSSPHVLTLDLPAAEGVTGRSSKEMRVVQIAATSEGSRNR